VTSAKEERDRHKCERDQLLEAIEAHRTGEAEVPLASMAVATDRLYELADQIKSKGGGAHVRETDPQRGDGTTGLQATRGCSDQVDGVAPEQTLYGLASWLVSMDEPGSSARQTVTLTAIIEAAREALSHDATALASDGEDASKEPETCPTCGQPVEVHRDSEPTSYYLPVVEDCRLQELLEWVEGRIELEETEASMCAPPDQRGEWKAASVAYKRAADRIHQLQANEETESRDAVDSALVGLAIQEFVGRAEYARTKGLHPVAQALESAARFLYYRSGDEEICEHCEGLGVAAAQCKACNYTGYKWPACLSTDEEKGGEG